MPAIENPFNVSSPLGASIGNLMRAFTGGMGTLEERQARAAQAEYYGANTAKAKAETALKQQEFGAPQIFSQALAGMYGELPEGVSREALITQNMPAAVEAMARSGKYGDIGSVFRAFVANAPGVGNQAIDRSMLGAGDTYASTPGGFGADQQRQRDEAAAKDATARLAKSVVEGQILQGMGAGDKRIAVLGQPGFGPNLAQEQAGAFRKLPTNMQAFAVGPTADETRGGLIAQNFGNLGGLTTEQQTVLGARPNAGSATPRNYILPDGARGVTLDGLTDATTKQALPQGAQVFTGQVAAASPGDLTTPVKGDLQRSQIALGDFNTVVGQLKDIAVKDPTLFGTVGNLRRIGQAAAGQANNVSTLLGAQQFGSVATQLQQAGVAPQFFDPNLTDIDKLATLAAYQAANVLAGQSGRGLSNQDFVMFRNIIGNPESWLSTQQSFVAGLDRVQSLTNEMAQTRQRIMQNGMGGAPSPAAAPGAPAPPAAAGAPAPNAAALRAEADAAIRAGKDPAAVKQRFKSLTGQDY